MEHPAAYFGKLTLGEGAPAWNVHPHLLLRNAGRDEVSVTVSILGKTQAGDSRQHELDKLEMASGACRHFDLEMYRQRSRLDLMDGFSGLRIIHTGRTSDLVAELINVDETEDFVFYDRFRNLATHNATAHAVISFDISAGSRSLIVLRNVTTDSVPARVSINYNGAERPYILDFPHIPGEDCEVIDLAELRDRGRPDINGLKLPHDAEYGGALISAVAGTIIASDPTIFWDPERLQLGANLRRVDESVRLVSETGSGVGSCVDEITDGPPPAHPYTGQPFDPKWGQCLQAKSCAHGLKEHTGVDIFVAGLPLGEPVRAMERGTVSGLNGSKSRGDRTANAVIIRGIDQFITIYAHVKPRPGLKIGDPVAQGDVIGTIDDSGWSNDINHLHLTRLPPGDGSYDGTVTRVDNDEYTCDFTVPCLPLRRTVEALARWPFENIV
jgi:hypothetical protein